MNAAASPAPRLVGGLFGSVLLHVGLFALFFFARPSVTPAPPPPYRVHLLAAPAGERALATPATPAVAPAPAPPTVKPVAAKPRPAVTATKPKAPAKASTKALPKVAPKSTPDLGPQPAPASPAKSVPAAPATQPAGGGPTGGRGNDVAAIDTPGIEFDYPWYVNAIARGVITRFNAGNSTLVAEVRFVIKRDGSVDPETIRIVTSSRNYSFDQRALAAVEAAANAHAFPALPGSFREDILPVTFRFSPSSYR
jgi:protein TonB